MSERRTTVPPRSEELIGHGAASAPPVASGERETRAPRSDDVDESQKSVHERRTAPPPMALDEYQRTLAVTVRPPGLLEPRIDVADDDGRVTDPPTARRSESLARMGAVGAATPVPPRASAPPAYYPSDIPRAPAVPMLSIPVGPDSHTSGSERFAVSTDRPTELGLAAELADRSRVLRPAMPKARVAELALDHRSGFLLSRIDGKARIEEVLDVSGMAESEALSILGDLLRRGVVVFETAGRYTGRGSR